MIQDLQRKQTVSTEVTKLQKEMTMWGIGPKFARIFFLYLALTIILQFLRPDLFSIPQAPFLPYLAAGILLVILGFLLWGLDRKSTV
jgi:hypothetical protein